MNLVTPAIGIIVWMTVVFLLLFFLLKKFAWKPILEMIKERETKISTSLALAKQTQEEMKELKASNEKMLQEAIQEREAMLRQANTMKEGIIAEAKHKAQTEADRIVENARLNILNEKNAAMVELKNQIANLSIEMAEKMLREELSNKDKHRLFVEKQMENIKFN